MARNKAYEHKQFEALTEIAGGKRRKEKYPTFRIPMLQQLQHERHGSQESHQSSSSDYDSKQDD